MRDRPDLCRQIVERILGRPIASITLVQPESESTSITHRGVRFDVLVEGTDEVIEVEMQATEDRELPKRMRFYHSHLDRLMLDKGQPFEALRPAYVIFLCMFDPFDAGLPRYTFRSACEESPAIDFNDGSTSIVVNVGAFEDDGINSSLASLMRYIATEQVDETGYSPSEAMALMRDHTLDELFAKFDIA